MESNVITGKKTASKSRIRVFLSAIIGLVAVLLCVEAYLRLNDWRRAKIPILSDERPGALRYDEHLGWATRES